MKLMVEEASQATGTLLEVLLNRTKAEIEREAFVNKTKYELY